MTQCPTCGQYAGDQRDEEPKPTSGAHEATMIGKP